MCKKAVSKVVKVATLGIVDLDKQMKPPKLPEAPAAPEAPPTAQDADVVAARADENRRRLAAQGQGSTILTGSLGVQGQANTGKKTVLGA